jgi:hypothetical protein
MRRFALVSIFAIAVSACSSSSSSDDGSNANVTAAQACTDALNAICDKIAACAPLEVDLAYGSVDACKQRIGASCPGNFTLPGTSATPALYEGCSKVIPTLDCAAVLADLDTALAAQPACKTQPGTLANGAACGDASQCKSTNCAIDSSTGCGVCADQPKAGDACIKGTCGHGLGLACAANKCVVPAGAGQSCSDTTPCAAQMTCVKGTCAVHVATVGASCQLGLPHDQFADCDATKGLVCQIKGPVPANNVGACQKAAESKAGESCTIVDAVKVCTASGRCTNYAKGGTCQAAAADGGACDDVNGPPCLAPAQCINKVCKIVDPASCK